MHGGMTSDVAWTEACNNLLVDKKDAWSGCEDLQGKLTYLPPRGSFRHGGSPLKVFICMYVRERSMIGSSNRPSGYWSDWIVSSNLNIQWFDCNTLINVPIDN